MKLRFQNHSRQVSTYARIFCLHRRIKWPPRRSARPVAFSGTEIGVTLTEIQTHRAVLLSKLQNFVTSHQEASF